MTLLLGFAREDEVYLFADSAATLRGRTPKDDYSSFGQLQRRDEAAIEERALKIVHVRNDLVVAICGVADHGFACTEFLRTAIGASARDVMDVFLASRPWPVRADCTLMLAYMDRGRARLCEWHASEPDAFVDVKPGVLSVAGSSSTDPAMHAEIVETVAELCCHPAMSGQHLLVSITAALQMIGAHNDLMGIGIGGAFVGVFVNRAGVVWQEDTVYLLYSSRLLREPRGGAPAIGPIVAVYPRASAVFLSTRAPKSRETLMMSSSVSTTTPREWIDAHYSSTSEDGRLLKAAYYSFVDTLTRRIVIFAGSGRGPPADAFRLEVREEELHVSMAPQLHTQLSCSHDGSRVLFALIDPRCTLSP